jgi:ribulose-phosphate 3-epimerase
MALVFPSILSADFTKLEAEIKSVEKAGADGIHLDVMDGHFVPNLTFGPILVEAIRRMTRLPLDVHLMISEPLRYAAQFVKAGADYLTIHVEAVDDPARALAEVKRLGVRAGISLNPETQFKRIEPALGQADLVLVMSVHPGFGGQPFIPGALAKVEDARKVKQRGGTMAWIAIDGGINRETSELATRTGAEILVAGAAIFKSEDRGSVIQFLKGMT